MITVDQLYDYDNFKNLLNQYFPLEKFAIENNVVRLNDSIISCLAEEKFLSAKEIITSIVSSTDSSVQSLFEIDQKLVDEFKQEIKVENDFYIFSGSKTAFAYAFNLHQLSPSVNQFIIAAYEMLNSIKFVGSGKGVFVILKPISDLTLEFFNSIVASRIDFYNNSKNLKHTFKILQQDALHYQGVIVSLEKQNAELNSLIKKLNYDQYLSTQMTWR